MKKDKIDNIYARNGIFGHFIQMVTKETIKQPVPVLFIYNSQNLILNILFIDSQLIKK